MNRAPPAPLRFESTLAAPVEAVWAAARTAAGINFELGPWIRMALPTEGDIFDLPVGDFAGACWLLFLGVLPFDRHRLRLMACIDGPAPGFDEDSTSWLQRRWMHRRRIEPRGAGCVVIDEVIAVPRIGLFRGVVTRIAAATFCHRHARLRRRFGAA
ncbi:MAG: hypothetical protein KC620_13055 [Myxococcales bacterium]|nr:hypothetical protein [Myxococcales bacterium]